MIKTSFKERVRKELIEYAKLYEKNFVNVEYYLYTSQFKYAKYYKIKAYGDNFLHLTGVHTKLKPSKFFKKCINETLSLNDLEITKKQHKGAIRRKLSVFPIAMNLFYSGDILVEEKFVKNRVNCDFASEYHNCTMGFACMENSKPKTLLKGNLLKNPKVLELICKKENNILTVIYNKTDLSQKEIEKLFK